jgi:brefeldin A-resistance guanine nucleotide exchange factor 1
MPSESLGAFTQSLLSYLPPDDVENSPKVIVVKPPIASPTPIRPNGQKPQPTTPDYDPALVCVLELATVLATRDQDSVSSFGKDVAQSLKSVIHDADNLHPVTVGRASYYLLNLLKASDVSTPQDGHASVSDNKQDHEYVRAPVVLHTISSFNQDLLQRCGPTILKGMSGCIKGSASLRKEMATSPDFWSVLHALQPNPEAAPLAFHITEDIATGSPQAITADNYESAVGLLNTFATVSAVREQRKDPNARRGKPAAPEKRPAPDEATLRGVRAMAIVSQMTGRVPAFIEQSHLEPDEAWQAYWLPIFRCFIMQCVSPSREILQQSFASLQRCLLSNDLASPEHKEWTNIFGQVVFPLVQQLLKPEVYQTDPFGMGEMRVQTAQLLCKIFLHYLVMLSEWDGMHDLWMEILDLMDRLVKSGQGDTLVSQPVSLIRAHKTDISTLGGSGIRISQEYPARHVQWWLPQTTRRQW